MHLPCASELDQRDALGVARLETHRLAGGTVEPHPEGLGTSDAQRSVGLEEVEVRADLDRSVPDVLHRQLDRAPSGVRLDVAALEQILAWNHGNLLCRRAGSN